MDIVSQHPATFDDAPGIGMTLLADGTTPARTRVDVATLAPGSSLPRHAAGTDQVFHVVSGTGRVGRAVHPHHPVG